MENEGDTALDHEVTLPPAARRRSSAPPSLASRNRERGASEAPPSSLDAEAGDSPARESRPSDPLGIQSRRLSWIKESAPISNVPLSLRTPQRKASTAPPSLLSRDRSPREVAVALLRLVFARRRLQQTLTCGVECAECLAPHLDKALWFIARGEPIHFVLPAFPAKSGNDQKVLGRLPDKAEEIALIFLQNLCSRIGDLYSPGARLTICSDGHVFSDVVGINDDDVTTYQVELREMLGRIGARSIDVFNLADQLGDMPYGAMRAQLVSEYAQSMDTVRRRITSDVAALRIYNGISRFLFEDFLFLESHKTRTQVRNMTKERAYLTIQRSDAWSRLVEEKFPGALRLSIHPQPAHSSKIGIHLAETLDNWLTPWHATAVRSAGRFVLMKRYHAERLRPTLVRDDRGHPNHYMVEHIDFERLQPMLFDQLCEV